MRIKEQSSGHFRLHIPTRWDKDRQELELAQFLETQQRMCWSTPEYTPLSPKITEVVLRVFPQVQLPELTPQIDLPPVQQPNPELIQSHLVDLQYQRVQATEANSVEKNQRITLNAFAEINGIPVPGTALYQYQGLVRNDLIAPGFFRHLLGMKPTETRRFKFALPDLAENATRKVIYHVTVLKTENLNTLPLDMHSNDFPKALNQSSWPCLIQHLHKILQNKYISQWQKFVRSEVIDQICRHTQIDMPTDLFLYTAKNIWQQEEGHILHKLALPQKLIQLSQKLWNKTPEKQAHVYQALKRSLVIQAIAQQEHLSPDAEDILLFLRPFATHFECELSNIYTFMQEHNLLQAVIDRILSEKVCDWLIQKSRFYDQGKEVTFKLQNLNK